MAASDAIDSANNPTRRFRARLALDDEFRERPD
jgi:hypothetical protein